MTEQPRYRTHVGLSEINPSPTNPRKHFNEAELAELAASIKEHGVITPILIRLINDLETPHLYEIVAGERRWRAAKLAGLTTIPAFVRDDLSPAAVIEIQLIENLQRQDLHPLEEAEGYGRMMREHGYSADTLAEKIGKSRSYIFGRMKLLDLDEDGRRLFYAGLLNPSTALLIARIPTHKLQAKAIEDITEKDWRGDVKSVRAAAQHIQARYMTNLNSAPFPPDDAELIALAGPCGACPKRTGNAPDLFDDVEDANVCTDPDCFVAKKQANAERIARQSGAKVITGAEAEKIMPQYGGESRTHAKLDSTCYDDPERRTYREIIGEDTKAVALVEQGKGDLVEIVPKKVIAEKLKAAGIVTRKEVEKEDDKKLKAKVDLANAWRDSLFRQIRQLANMEAMEDGISALLSDALPIIARRFLLELGFDRGGKVAGLWGAIGSDNYSRFDAFKTGLPNMSIEQLFLFILDCALISEQRTDQYNYQNDPECLITIARALEIDPEAEFKKCKETIAAAEKAKKPAKKPKKTTPATSEDHLPPTEAAPAAGTERAESEADATQAAPAGEENPPEKATAEEHKSAAGAAVEEPSGAELMFAVGDVVHVKAGALMNGGKGGQIDCVYNDGRSFPYEVTIDGKEYCFSENEIELVAKAEAIETDEKPPATKRQAVQYRHPENNELEWTGRGRKPQWVITWLATEGNTLDDLKIEEVAA